MAQIKKLLEFIKLLIDNKWTGQLRLNFYKGDISKKIDKKESFKIT